MELANALGARVRALREQAGIQSRELAAILGLDPSAMSNIENGKRAVKTDELAAIAHALRVSPLALLDDDSLPARMPVAPRSDGGTLADGTVYPRLIALTELHEVLRAADIPSCARLDDVPGIDAGSWKLSADALADWTRKKLEVDAMGDERFSVLADAIEDGFGIDVLVEEHTGDPLAGAAVTDREFPLVFVNASQNTPRALFTLAHELGHLLAGHDDGITLDTDLSGWTASERLANAYAASFLMPEADIENCIEEHGALSAESLVTMTYRFGVSFESLIYRLHNLQIINAQGRDQLRSDGWRALLRAIEQPQLADRIPVTVRKSLLARLGNRPERRAPGWLVGRALAGYREGVISVRPLAGLLDEDPDSLIEQLQDPSQLAIGGDYVSQGERVSDEDLYDGSPI